MATAGKSGLNGSPSFTNNNNGNDYVHEITNVLHFEEMLSMLDVQTITNPVDDQRYDGGCLSNLRRLSRNFFSIRAVRRGFDILALGSVVRLILVRAGAIPTNSECLHEHKMSCAVDILGYVIMGLFAFEQIVKILAFGWREYWRHWLNRLDFFVSAISVTATLVVDVWAPSNVSPSVFLIVSQVVPIVRLLRIVGKVLRLVRLLRFSRAAKKMLALVTHVVPNAIRLLAIIASAIYFFSVVGMESFAGCLSDASAVNGSSYQRGGLQPLNFDTFLGSIVTTFTMLMGNKYPILLEGTVACYGHTTWPMVYYFGFYVVVVCFLLNVFIAFILAVYNEVEAVHGLEEGQEGIVPRATDTIEAEVASLREARRNSQLSISSAVVGSPRLLARAQRSWSTHGSVLTSFLTGDARSMGKSGIMIRTHEEEHLRGRVQSLLMKRPPTRERKRAAGSSAVSEPKRESLGGVGGAGGGGGGRVEHSRENSGEVLLRNSGPKAKDVERLMLQRHRKTNTSANEGGRVTVAVQDSIHRRIASESERVSALDAVERLARILGVEASQLTVEARI